MRLKNSTLVILCLAGIVSILTTKCSENKTETPTTTTTADQQPANGGFASKVKWGEHLVTVGACNDCHTPKKMTAAGPVIDSTLMFSGHPEHMPIPDIDRKMVESKGLAVTNTLTSWVGPWGVSFAANISSDSTTGIGAWSRENFFTAIRQGKKSGAPAGRSLLPPMPWDWFRYMSDDELDAIFAYLQSTKPIHNAVPAALPPIAPPMHP